jgi:hypothetical protein
MSNRELLKVFALIPVVLLCWLLGTSIASAATVPKADCGGRDHTESGLQGQTTTEERFSGDSELGYNCNLRPVGEFRGEGAFSQNGPAYAGNCAYFGTDNITPLQRHRGVVVVDASDPRHPQVSDYLDETPAMLAPHETLWHNDQRNLLVAGEQNGPGFAVYDTSATCRHPVWKSNIRLSNSDGHMGATAPDGLTYYLSQSFRGVGGFMYIVDLTDPSDPQQLPTWQFLGDGRPHGLLLNPEGFPHPGVHEGTRLYAGQANSFPFDEGGDGLVIEDVSDYQFRRPDPQIRIISTLFWTDQGTAEPMIPVKINGHPYIISTDEAGGAGGEGGWAAACDRGAAPFGYPQLIDVSDETHPTIVAKLMLEVNDPANCSQLLAETPPDPPGTAPGTNLPDESGTTNYSNERCVADDPMNAKMLACSFQNAGLRVFDVRDPLHVKEVAYFKPPAVRTEVRPGSGSWAPGVDRTVDKIAGWVRWHKVGRRWELWTVSDGNGFQILRFTRHFGAQYGSLFAHKANHRKLSRARSSR